MSNYKHGMVPKFAYTEGVRTLAAANNAYWLVDLVAITARMVKPVADEPFVAWTVAAERTARGFVTVTATDGGKKDGEEPIVLWKKLIPYSDIPASLLPLRMFTVESADGHLLMLAEEY